MPGKPTFKNLLILDLGSLPIIGDNKAICTYLQGLLAVSVGMQTGTVQLKVKGTGHWKRLRAAKLHRMIWWQYLGCQKVTLLMDPLSNTTARLLLQRSCCQWRLALSWGCDIWLFSAFIVLFAIPLTLSLSSCDLLFIYNFAFTYERIFITFLPFSQLLTDPPHLHTPSNSLNSSLSLLTATGRREPGCCRDSTWSVLVKWWSYCFTYLIQSSQ